MLAQAVFSAFIAYFIWSVFSLLQNAAKARAMNVPTIKIPVDPNNVLWMIFQAHIFYIIDRLPWPYSTLPDFIRLTRRGWYFREKSEIHVRLGSVWALVTPAAIYLHFADPNAINEIFSRRKDFVRPIKEYKLLEVYGPCLSTAGWDDWPRHRKVLAAPFNEKIMQFVWEESLRQSNQMLSTWIETPGACISSVQKDTRTLSLNVLAAIGFQKSYEFRSSSSTDSEASESFRDALQTVLDNVILLMLVPYTFLMAPMMPKRWKRLGHAAVRFKDYMMQMLEEETSALSRNPEGSGGIMTSFVRALEVHKQESPDLKISKDGKKGLRLEEIMGNLFVINFAGHDTTANTLAFSLLLLAGHPKVQAWVSEEIEAVVKDMPLDKWNYEDIFPQLKRCCAVLNETLRLFPPVMALPKWTSAKTQSIYVGDKVVTIPPGSGTVLSLLAIQTHPQYWEDPYAWRPARWIQAVAGGTREELVSPLECTFFPWSNGPQNCPGRKFSEVEAVAVLTCLLRSYRLTVQREKDESDREACRRAVICANNVDMEMLLRMRNADSITIVCEKV